MGARPIALMDPLRFGPLDDPRSRWIAEGSCPGYRGYGNSVGVPTVGGETVFDPTYQDNPLVNVFCLGVLPAGAPRAGRGPPAPGNLTVLFGSSTGRDGIGGASVLASAGFGEDEDDADKRPSVQVGDPFEEKRLIEACLEILDARPRRRHPGPRRRRHHRRRQRDVVEGRRRHGPLPLRGATSARRGWRRSRS